MWHTRLNESWAIIILSSQVHEIPVALLPSRSLVAWFVLMSARASPRIGIVFITVGDSHYLTTRGHDVFWWYAVKIARNGATYAVLYACHRSRDRL